MVMEALKNGVKIPQDIAIMGVDDQPLASYLQIPLTTIWQPVQDEGRCAAKEMVRQLKGEFRRNKKKRVGFEADSQTVGINRTETGMKIEPVFKNKKLVTIPNEKQRRICKRKTQIKKLKMIKKEEEQKW